MFYFCSRFNIIHNYNGFINGSSSYTSNSCDMVITEYKERKTVLFMIPYQIIENYWYDYSVGSTYKEIYIVINETIGTEKVNNVKIAVKNVSIIVNNHVIYNIYNLFTFFFCQAILLLLL